MSKWSKLWFSLMVSVNLGAVVLGLFQLLGGEGTPATAALGCFNFTVATMTILMMIIFWKEPSD